MQQATELSGALPEADACQVCEPLEVEIVAFVHRAAGGGDGAFTHEAAGNFVLLAEAVEECMRRARELLNSLEALMAESRAHASPGRRRSHTSGQGSPYPVPPVLEAQSAGGRGPLASAHGRLAPRS